MFQTLTQNLNKVFDKIRGRGALTNSQITAAMDEIRIVLLDSDVALPVVKDFIAKVSEKALGQEVIKSVSPGQMIIKIIHDELVAVLSANEEDIALNLKTSSPANILMVGLQGSGKTTATSKLALYLQKQRKKSLLVSLDIYRPAAQEQLAQMAAKIGAESLPIVEGEDVIAITKRAQKLAKFGGYDVIIYDSAGRLHLDKEMINEVKTVKEMINPSEILLVVDSMIGQEALNISKSFDEALNITGIILSRIDGDSKGGAALSMRATINKPIKFLSKGEKAEDLEVFDAERIAMRILDKGDVVSFVEKASSLMDEEQTQKSIAKMQQGKFDLNDYINQIKMIQKMGGLSSIISMIPGINKLSNKLPKGVDESTLTHQEAIILSMTKKERRNPNLLNASRRKRIAEGSGTTLQAVNKLMSQYKKVSVMMKKASKIDPKSLARGGFDQLFS